MPDASNRLIEPLDRALAQPQGAWADLIGSWRSTEAGQRLVSFVDARVAAGAVVYPAQVMRALELTPLETTRVVIVGQDPYHGPGQAQGLAFSVGDGVRVPPSLRNIFKELERDLGLPAPASGDLSPWAAQGVLLLNTSLTVEDGAAGSHARHGWESLTDLLITATAAAARTTPIVFMLWGAHAQAKRTLIEAHLAASLAAQTSGQRPLILEANHPSPLSATRGPLPFLGCGHFGLANQYFDRLSGVHLPLDWRLR